MKLTLKKLALLGILTFNVLIIKAQPVIHILFDQKSMIWADSVSISLYQNGRFWDGVSSYRSNVYTKDGFALQLPRVKNPKLIRLGYYRNGKLNTLGDYFVEANDTIRITISKRGSKDDISFYGKQSLKYQITRQLALNLDNFKRHKLAPLKLLEKSNDEDLILKLEHLNRIVREATFNDQLWIDSIGKELSEEVRSIIKYEFCRYYTTWNTHVTHLYSGIYKDHKGSQEIIKKHYNANNNLNSYQTSSISSICPYYNQCTAVRLIDSLYINTEGGLTQNLLYSNIKEKFKEKSREAIMAELFGSPYSFNKCRNVSSDVSDSLIIDALNYIRVSNIRQMLLEKAKLSPGKSLYTTSFIKPDGTTFLLKSLAGKVILIDIWGAGCTGCAMFHQIFKQKIYPTFKNNKDFVVLSISVDKTRNRWLEGIQAGKLTSSEYLNVYTGGMGIKHPFTIHYGINSLPFLLLVDQNQKIYSKISTGVDSQEIIAMISDLLYKK